MMKDNKNQALKALDSLYKAGYYKLETIQNRHTVAEGIFVSDCGILFTRKSPHDSKLDEFKVLLGVVKNINKRVLLDGFLLTTSIAYGEFRYQERRGLDVMTKNALLGNAYLNAYKDSEVVLPKLAAGQCRIVSDNLPQDVIDYISSTDLDEYNRFIDRFGRKRKHYYYWWMAGDMESVEQAKEVYGRKKEYDLWRNTFKDMIIDNRINPILDETVD